MAILCSKGPEMGVLKGKKRTKTSILCSKCPKTRVLKAWAPTVYAEELPTLLEMAVGWPGTGQGQMIRHRTKNRRGGPKSATLVCL